MAAKNGETSQMTCNTVYDSTHYFFRDVDFEGADEGSDFPYGDDRYDGGFCLN